MAELVLTMPDLTENEAKKRSTFFKKQKKGMPIVGIDANFSMASEEVQKEQIETNSIQVNQRRREGMMDISEY